MDELVPEALQDGELRFRVISPVGGDGNVSASLFAEKLKRLVSALRAADKALNEVVTHDYKIAKLSSSNPTVVLAEAALPKFEHIMAARSAIAGFEDCADAIMRGDRDRALQYGNCAHHIAKLGRGSRKNFSYAEVWIGTEIIRVDTMLVDQADTITHIDLYEKLFAPDEEASWFRGSAYGSFDGTILEVDLRGALPEVKLVLNAGGAEIACVFKREDLEKVRAAIDKRARVYGTAVYDGRSGLPARINIVDIQPISPKGDLASWANTFDPYEHPSWDEDLGD
ncbi:hypothetical protein [Bradyrhizobium roseum]|uniref:hypothetical protein n=1 Tax=Bradyrhizobium roseum TaxID=3056648 RepID=UPI002618598D|nr:hypothetical protein [Bradyrhizobium roseus]WKA27822.1 hypothetical protein QUH67_30370 [Bradyrhizobium roseus]